MRAVKNCHGFFLLSWYNILVSFLTFSALSYLFLCTACSQYYRFVMFPFSRATRVARFFFFFRGARVRSRAKSWTSVHVKSRGVAHSWRWFNESQEILHCDHDQKAQLNAKLWFCLSRDLTTTRAGRRHDRGLPFELICVFHAFFFLFVKETRNFLDLMFTDVFCFDFRKIQPKRELRHFNTLTFRCQIYLNYLKIPWINEVCQYLSRTVFWKMNCKYHPNCFPCAWIFLLWTMQDACLIDNTNSTHRKLCLLMILPCWITEHCVDQMSFMSKNCCVLMSWLVFTAHQTCHKL